MTKEIDRRKEKKAQLEGELRQLSKTLAEEFDCTSLEQAEKKLDAMRKEAATLEEELETALSELEDKYDLTV